MFVCMSLREAAERVYDTDLSDAWRLIEPMLPVPRFGGPTTHNQYSCGVKCNPLSTPNRFCDLFICPRLSVPERPLHFGPGTSGFQYTPVLSMATCVTWLDASQSHSSSSSRVTVPNRRICCCVAPASLAVSKQAEMLLLWTSSPQQCA